MIEQTVIRAAKQASQRLKFSFPYDITEWVTQKNMLMENYHKHTTWSNLVQFDAEVSGIRLHLLFFRGTWIPGRVGVCL